MSLDWCKRKDIIKYLVTLGYCHSLKTADNKIKEWLEFEELYSKDAAEQDLCLINNK